MRIGPPPWKQVQGPAGAAVATLKRIGWSAKNAVTWVTHAGVTIDLRSTCPVTVAKLVDAGTVAWQWQHVARQDGLQELAAGGLIAPLRKLLQSQGADWSRAHAAALRCAVINGQWPQQRLAAAGYSADATCQLCHAASGTLYHRHWGCDGIAALRLQEVEPGVLAASRGPTAGSALWSRALFPDPARWLQPPVSEPMTHWFKLPEDACFTGRVYIDGSGTHPAQPSLRRIGFGIAAVSSQGHLTGAAYGPVAYPLQVVPVAELFALLMLLRHSMPPLAAKSDCQSVVQGIARGRVWCTAAERPHADVWDLIWTLLDDYGDYEITKVKAHSTQADVDVGRVLEVDRTGNNWADAMAKQGAKKHPTDESDELRCRRADMAVAMVAKWIGRVTVHLSRNGDLADVVPKAQRLQPAARVALRQQRTDRGTNGRLLQPVGNRFFCAVCLRSSQSRVVLLSKRCKGSPSVEQLAHASHTLLRSGNLWWCNVCGCYGSLRLVGLKGPCPGRAKANWGQLHRLQQGWHPVSRAALPTAVPARPCCARGGVQHNTARGL